MPPVDVGVSPDDPWFGYVSTIVQVVRPDATDLAIRAAPAGQVDRWPWTADTPVFVLTAWDPGDERFSDEVNRSRQTALESELQSQTHRLWRARGFDPSTGYRDEGVAVCGLSEGVVLDAGARFGQDAVFSWTPGAWAIVSCSAQRRLTLGWILSPPLAL